MMNPIRLDLQLQILNLKQVTLHCLNSSNPSSLTSNTEYNIHPSFLQISYSSNISSNSIFFFYRADLIDFWA